MTTRRASPFLAGNVRQSIRLDLLLGLGLALVGASVYLWQGLPAVLAYTGIVLIVAAVALSQEAGP